MFQEVMLLEQREKTFNDPNFIYEPKIDGHRLQLNFTDGKTTLFTRHNNDCTRQYPELHHFEIDGDVILDGEVCCINPETGAIDFELVMSRFQIKDPAKVATVMKRLPVSYVVFDILRYNGQDLRGLPLMKRKEILHNVLPDTLQIHKIPFIEKDGISLFNEIKKLDMEGIVAKRKDSLYIGKRSSDWIKVINYQNTDVYLTEYRKGEFGWLASVMEMDGKLRPVGVIELGVPPVHKQAFYGVCEQLVTGEDKEFVYLEPRLQATVKFRNWTKAGLLRSPVFVDFVLQKAG